MSWRTARPHPGSGRPRGAAPGAPAKAHSGSARSSARPPGPPEPCGPPGARQLLPAARASARSLAARVPAASCPRAPGASAAPQGSRIRAPPWSLCPRGCASWVPAGARKPRLGQSGRSEPAELPKVPVDSGSCLASAQCWRLGDSACGVSQLSPPAPQSLRHRPLPTQTQSGLPADSSSSPPSLPLTSVHLSPIFLPKAPRQRWT